MKLLIHCQTVNVWPLQLGNRYVISSNTLLGMWLLIHAVPQFIGHLWYKISLQNLSSTPVSRNCVWRKCITRYYPTVLTFLHSSGTVALYACAKNQSNFSEKNPCIATTPMTLWHRSRGNMAAILPMAFQIHFLLWKMLHSDSNFTHNGPNNNNPALVQITVGQRAII